MSRTVNLIEINSDSELIEYIKTVIEDYINEKTKQKIVKKNNKIDNNPYRFRSTQSDFNERPSKERKNLCYKSKLIPITEWNKHYSWPPLGGLRHLVFNAYTNGFDKVIRRVGRRVLIDEVEFFNWVDKNNECNL